jgi:hypothetical protein
MKGQTIFFHPFLIPHQQVVAEEYSIGKLEWNNRFYNPLKGQSHEKVGKVRVWRGSLGRN